MIECQLKKIVSWIKYHGQDCHAFMYTKKVYKSCRGFMITYLFLIAHTHSLYIYTPIDGVKMKTLSIHADHNKVVLSPNGNIFINELRRAHTVKWQHLAKLY